MRPEMNWRRTTCRERRQFDLQCGRNGHLLHWCFGRRQRQLRPDRCAGGVGTSSGAFQLNVTVNSPTPVTQESEPNGTLDNANSIALGTNVGGTIGALGDQDFYLFTLPSAGQLSVSAAADALSPLATRLTLYGSRSAALVVVRRPVRRHGLDRATFAGRHVLHRGFFGGLDRRGGWRRLSRSTSFVAATPPFADLPSGVNSVAMARGDLNHDGIVNLVTANQFSGDVSVMLGVGDGTFQPAVSYQPGFFPSGVVVSDFNHDGYDDVAVSNQYSGDVSILMNYGDGTLSSAVSYSVGGLPMAIAAGQFDADGNLDLAVATADPGAATAASSF